MRYMVASPDLSGNELAYVTECIQTTWISATGRFVPEFENQVSRVSGSAFGVATSNGTVALHLALVALGVGPGDEVIVPSLTYVATANAVTYCGATVVFADSDPDTWCISPESVARLITPRTKGILPVHLYGHPCEMAALRALAEKHNLWIVEDCAEAIGAVYDGKTVGSFGEAGVFSFFGNKIVTTGEGGMVVTSDASLDQALRLYRGQGMDLNRRYWHTVVGFNYRMTNVAAAIGVAQMERLPVLLQQRRRIAGWYAERLRGTPGVTLPIEREPATNVYWMYSVLLESQEVRDSVMLDLAARGIETRPFFHPAHRFPMYEANHTDAGCIIAENLAACGMNLPTSHNLSEADVEVITAEFFDALSRAGSKTIGQRKPARSAVR